MECKDRILGENYYDVITDYPIRPEGADNYDLCVWNVENLYNLIYIRKEDLTNPNGYFYEHRSRPKLYALSKPASGSYSGSGRVPRQEFDPTSLIAGGILQLQREPLQLTGKGVVTVFIDTGIDYLSPLFRKEDGSTRILAIWDQTIQSGTPPEGFWYGSLYTREEIDRAIKSDNPYEIVPSKDENGHGTNLAAVAVGTKLGDGRVFIGAAPEADIVVVKLKQCKKYLREFYLVADEVPAYEESDIIQAIQFGETYAKTFVQPVVYCLGLGTAWGDHSGSSALSGYISTVAARRSRAVVVSGGDEGNAAHHYRGDFGAGIGANNRRLPVEVRVGEKAKGFLMEFWGNVPDIYTISIRSPGGETIPSLRLGLNDIVTYSFIYEQTRVSLAGTLVEPVSGEELITIRMERPTAGIWTFFVEAVGDIHNGVFNMWLPMTEFLDTEVFFPESSPYVTLTEPGMARNTICTSTYSAITSGFLAESGRGFAAIGAVKPDISAPGVQVSAVTGKETGSGAAAAITAGAVAQFMQWAVVEDNNSVVESREIRNYLARGAARTFDLVYPSREWGYGRLDISGTFDSLIGV